MGNNPISYADPDGDLSFLATVGIGAGIGVGVNGVQNLINGNNFWEGWQNAAITGAVGGALGFFGGGSLVSEIAWGAVQGGITGAVGAGLNGGDVQQGFLRGALIGAGSAFLYNLPQAVNNYQDGFGFNTNIAAFKNAANEAIEGGIVDNNKANRALDFWMDRFGGPKLYRNKLVNKISPFRDPDNGRIYITDAAFLMGGDYTAQIILHETGHYYRSLIWENGIVGGKLTGELFVEGLDVIPDNGHGTIGYYDAIRQAGKYNIGYKTLNGSPQNYDLKGLYDNKAWKGFGWTKWWHVAPKRFK